MRAMRRASTPSAAIRAASSSCSQAAGGGLVRAEPDGGCGGSRNAKFSCMAALHVWCRLDVPAQESVDDLAKLEQITELAQRTQESVDDLAKLEQITELAERRC